MRTFKYLSVLVSLSILLTITSTRTKAQSWTELFPTGSIPVGRGGPTAVYDNTNNRMTIFGGGYWSIYLNEVWVLSTANGLGGTPAWTQLYPNPDPTYGFPTTRNWLTSVYDAASNRMTIFGGSCNNVGNMINLNDVWVLSYANGLGGTPAWVKLNPNPDPVIWSPDNASLAYCRLRYYQ